MSTVHELVGHAQGMTNQVIGTQWCPQVFT